MTFLVAEIVPGPGGPTLWQVIKNRITQPRGNSEQFDAAASPSGRA